MHDDDAIQVIDGNGNQAGWLWRDLAETVGPLLDNPKYDLVKMTGHVRTIVQHDVWHIDGRLGFHGQPGNALIIDENLSLWVAYKLSRNRDIENIENHVVLALSHCSEDNE